MKTNFLTGAGSFAALIVAAAISNPPLQAQGSAPKYEVDASWPKPLPDRWITGGLGGLCVDAQDHVVILNRQDILDNELNGGHLAPPIIEFDSAGNLVNSWGDLSVLDPRLHSCRFDRANNLWIASSPSGMVQKYSHDGKKLLLQIGKKGVFDSSDGSAKGTPLNSSAPVFFMPSSISFDPQNADVYVADGEGRGGNKRVAVLDRDGKFLRQWLPEGMNTVHCMSVANDGLVYVCNRENARIQVYDKMGMFIKNIEIPWTPDTPPADGKIKDSGGVAVALDFSHDPGQKFIYLINQNAGVVDILDRQSGKVLTSFGRIGHYPGQFDQAHGIAVDSQDNVYIAENRGKRVQKFRIVKK